MRLYNLSSVPPSPSLDEVSLGYNAYSILKTGGDEYGSKFPILLRAYDDWRPALYVYLVVPFVWMLGLTTFAVRIPSVILSVLTVFATYFLTKELFSTYFKKFSIFPGLAERSGAGNFKFSIGEIAAFLLAISPWHIYISRLGHEVNAGLSFFVFALTFFLRKNIYISSLFFVLSFMSYQSEKLFIPLIVLSLAVLFRKTVLEKKKEVVIALIVSIIIVIPFIRVSLTPEGVSRFNATSILNPNATFEQSQKRAQAYLKAKQENDSLRMFINSKRMFDASLVTNGYFSHFNPQWLFWGGQRENHKVPNLGLLYLFEFPLLILGTIFIVKSSLKLNIKIFLFVWLLIAPIPGALTTDAPHAMRSMIALPVPQIIGAIGLFSALDTIKKYRYSQRVVVILFFIILLVSVGYFFRQYYLVFPKTQSDSFQYALANALKFVKKNHQFYKKVIFSNQENLYQSYMFFLFHIAYDPILYQQQGGTKSGGYDKTHIFGKYEFRSIDWDVDSKLKNILLIGNQSDFSPKIEIKKQFFNLDYSNAVIVIER